MKALLILAVACWMAVAQTAPPKAPAKKAATAPAPPTPAPPPATTPGKWPVQKLVVEGNRAYTAEQVLALAGIKVGQLAGRAEFDGARDRLVGSGVFETVGYKFEPGPDKQGYVATFQVTEVEPAYPVRFEELGVPEKDVEAMLRAKDPLFSPARLPASKLVMDRYVAWIQDYLTSKNVQEKIAAKVTAVTSDQFAIVFRPARNLPAVAAVTFSGNQVVPQGVLREAIAGVAVGAPYTEAAFREILNSAVRPVYEQRGRVRVSFPEVRAETVGKVTATAEVHVLPGEAADTGEVAGVHVFVKIDEGVSYELGKVEIAGPSPVDPAALLKTGDFKTGDVANMDKVAEGLEKIRKAVRRAGYLDAKVTQERKINDEKKAVDVSVHIDAGALYLMGKLTLVGLDLNGEAEIQRIWTLKEGKTFNPEYPDYFLNRIKEQALFEGLGQTKADVKVDEKRHVADVTLRFAGEDPTKKPRKDR